MITLLFACFFGLVLLRAPVAIALLLSSFLVILVDGLPPTLVALRLFAGLMPFPILAIPLFYFLGILCNAAGFTDRIMELARLIVGRVRAGLAHVNIVASMLFAGISGSNTADTAAIGAVLIPQMLKAGYGKRFTVAVTASSSTMGNIIPPSITMVIYGAFGDVSIAMLFLGGFIPGVLIGLGQMAVVWVLARYFGFGARDVSERPPLLRTLRRGLIPLVAPFIIIGGIVGGVFTPTESAAIAILYVLTLSSIFYRELTVKSLAKLLDEGVRFIALPLLMVASAAIFAWLLAYHEFPENVADWVGAFGASRFGVLVGVVALYLIVGCFLDTIPAIIIFLPIVRVLGDAVGIHPVQMGVIVCMTLAFGSITPPYGICLLVASRIANVHPREAMAATVIFGSVGIVIIVLAMFFPEITLFLPKLFMARFFSE